MTGKCYYGFEYEDLGEHIRLVKDLKEEIKRAKAAGKITVSFCLENGLI
jgi:hypothetical protein